MTDIIILHHYDTSPYSEKVRLGLGLKGLAWASVEIPVIMPKPDLTALTGGYRKTPVLQIGADIYCDSQLIMRELERRHPSPGFYPAGRGGRPRRPRGLPPHLVLAAKFRTGGSTARRISKAIELGRARRRHWPRRPAPHDVTGSACGRKRCRVVHRHRRRPRRPDRSPAGAARHRHTGRYRPR